MSPLTESVRLTLAKGQPVPNDPYLYTNTVLLLHGDGTNGSTSIVDSSRVAGGPKTVTAFGNAQISTAQSKFGGASIAFDGTGDYLSTPSNADYNFGVGNFTIELWYYANTTQVNYSFAIARNNEGIVFDNLLGSIYFRIASPQVYVGIGTFLKNNWVHLAVCRSAGTLYTFANGLLGSQVANSTNVSNNGALIIGAETTGTNYFNGYIDDLRITKGVARYTANFTPPTAPFPDF